MVPMHHSAVELLVGTVAGYWMLERAETHKGDLKKLGRFLGWLIILASLAGMLCRVWALSSACQLGMAGKSRACPFGFKSAMR